MLLHFRLGLAERGLKVISVLIGNKKLRKHRLLPCIVLYYLVLYCTVLYADLLSSCVLSVSRIIARAL